MTDTLDIFECPECGHEADPQAEPLADNGAHPFARDYAVFCPRCEEPVQLNELAFAHAYNHGNYASAYEGERLDPAKVPAPYFARAAYLLGFYSSFELHEVPAAHRAQLRRLRADFEGY